MPSGLQTWNADGSVQLDTTLLVGRILGSVSIAAGQTSGSISHDAFSTGTPFAFPLVDFSGNAIDLSPTFSLPQISVSGGTLTWTRASVVNASAESLPAGIIYFGVY